MSEPPTINPPEEPLPPVHAEESPIVSAAPSRITVEYAPRKLRMHQVSDTELDAIVSGGNSIHMTFFGLCGGVVVTCVVVLTTVTMTDPVTHAGYVAALIVCGVLGLFLVFGA